MNSQSNEHLPQYPGIRERQRDSHLGVWELNIDNKTVYWSPEACKVWGVPYSPLGYPLHEVFLLVHPHDRDRVDEALQNAQALGAPFEIQHRVVLASGRERMIEAQGHVVTKADGSRSVLGTLQDATDRVRAEERLREKDVVLRMSSRMAKIGGWKVDFVSQRILWSDEACVIFGLPLGSAPSLDEALTAFFDSADHGLIRETISACARQGKPFDIQVRGQTARKQALVIRSMGEPISGEDGAITGIYGAMQDITDLHRAAQQAGHVATMLSVTLETITDAFYMLDEGWRFTYVNQAFECLTKRRRQDILGTYVWDEFSKGEEDIFEKQFDLARREARPVQFETYYPPLEVWGEVRVFPTEEGISVYIRDITDAKRAQQQAQESLARIQEQASLLDQAQDSIIVRDIDGVVRFWNKGAERLYGWSAAEICGQVLVQDADNEVLRQATETVLRRGEWHGELTITRKDGEKVITESYWNIVATNDGRPPRIFSVSSDITERKQAEENIRQLAYYDLVTHLPNRRLLQSRLAAALARSLECACEGALLFIDLDDFKRLNDTLGHDMGDLLLGRVAQRLLECVRKTDTVARLGGDEFVVLLEDLDTDQDKAKQQVEAVARKILAAINEPYLLGVTEHYTTPSIGAVLFNQHKGGVGELLKRADLAMYRAKELGRNTLCFFDPSLQRDAVRRAQMATALRQGLQRGEFRVVYQPQFRDDRKIFGAEALVRWTHPERGLISPAEFIPVAEDMGLIQPLGRFVLETACRQIHAWSGRPGNPGVRVAVNVSARQFRQPDFVQMVRDVLQETGAAPNMLKLELTESILVESVEDTVAKMMQLRADGVSFALDDFGTGYSSLSYLKILPLSELKIDKSFVQDALKDVGAAAIVKSIIALAPSLSLEVIAEGVETEEQLRFLGEHGCRHYQGYLFAHPLTGVQFERRFLDATVPPVA